MADKTAMFDTMPVSMNFPESADRSGAYAGVQNPYSGQSYNEGWFTRLLGDLGLRTQEDQRREDLSIQAAEFEAGLALKQHDEEFNSPAAKAQRMRAAGLNPDLLGTDQAENASPMGEDPSTPQAAPGADTPFVLGSSLMKGVSIALGFAKDIAEIDSIELGNAQSLFGLGSDSLGLMFPPEILEGGQIRSDLPWEVMNRASAFSQGLRPRVRNRFMRNIENFVGSMDFSVAAMKKASENNTSKSEYFDSISRAGSDLNRVTLILAETLRDLAETNKLASAYTQQDVIAAEGAEAEARLAKANLEKTVAEGIDPDMRASAENKTNEATTYTKTTEAEFAKPVAEGMEKLDKEAKRGNSRAAKVLLGFSIASLLRPEIAGIINIASKMLRH